MTTNLRRASVATAVALGVVLLKSTAYAAVTEVIAAGTMAFSELSGGPATVTVRRLTIAPGEVLGWHYHPGVGAYTVVKRGVLTLEDGCGGETVFTVGQAFLEHPGRVHRGKNLGVEELETIQTFIVPAGTPISVSTAGLCLQISSGALDLSVGTDNKARVVSADLDNRAAFRSYDNFGNSTSGGLHGPFNGWYARALADGPDRLTRVLWNNLDGSTGLWLLGATGNPASYRYAAVAGWTAVDVSVGPDNTTHILWTNIDGRIGLWSLNLSGAVVNAATFGPYTGWLAHSISDGADGLTRVLWTKTDGSIGLSLIGAAGIVATHRFEAAVPGWTARDIAVASDNQARILLVDADRRVTLWSVDNSGAVTSSGTVYGPPQSGQHAARISAGADGLTRVLWTSPDGTGTVWLMGLDNVRQSSFGLGPN